MSTKAGRTKWSRETQNSKPDCLSDWVDEELSLGGFEDRHPEQPEHPPPARDEQLGDPDDDVPRLPTENTGWPFRLVQTSRWHQNSSVLVWGPCTKTQLCYDVTGRFDTTWMITLYTFYQNLNFWPKDVLRTLDELGLFRAEGLGVDSEGARRYGVHTALIQVRASDS